MTPLSTSAQSAKDSSSQAMLVVSYLAVAPTSTTIFSTFGCRYFDDGAGYLVADFSVPCGTAAHDLHVVFACLMVICYPIGIPLAYALLLYRKREYLLPESATPEEAITERKKLADDNTGISGIAKLR